MGKWWHLNVRWKIYLRKRIPKFCRKRSRSPIPSSKMIYLVVDSKLKGVITTLQVKWFVPISSSSAYWLILHLALLLSPLVVFNLD